jgi:NAD(P)-dependent dehydrogenase (short-subunit alcohol dehydrogenase family)
MKNAQTILIAGATSGIGRHASLAPARAGRGVARPGATRRRSPRWGPTAWALPLDLVSLTDRGSLVRAVAEVTRLTSGRGVDVLVNNAGYGEMARMLEVREADVRAM